MKFVTSVLVLRIIILQADRVMCSF